MRYHEPVLRDEVVDLLAARDGWRVVDGTLGDGGHSEAILRASACRIIGVDQDMEALARAKNRLSAFAGRIVFAHGHFGDLKAVLKQQGVERVDGLLLDLGVSSVQLDSAGRGFSFMREGPLDMRMDQSAGMTAADILATKSDKELEDILRVYGEERFYRRIVRAIRKAQAEGPITSTLHLAHVVQSATVFRRSASIHPATRTFQALRIAVNDELGRLRKVLRDALDVLNNAGRILVISFHSLEDRIVKHFFQEQEKGCVCPPRIPACVCGGKRSLRILTRKPARPSAAEIARNPRSSSAKLRAAERVYA